MISLIAAIDTNFVISKQGRIPWHIPEDMKFFQYFTMGHPIIMGHETHKEIGKVLPGRINIVLTKQDIKITKCKVFSSLEDAINSHECPVIIGGSQVYKEALEKDMVDIMALTKVNTETQNGDRFFPQFDRDKWVTEWTEWHSNSQTAKNSYNFSISLYRRKT